MYPGTWAETAPDRPAIIMGGDGRVVTYRELDERSNRCAHLFRSLGLRVGDTVALLMTNTPRFHEIAWATRRSGLYITPLNYHLTAAEVAYIVRDCDARVLIAEDCLVTDGLPEVEHRFVVGEARAGWADYDAAVANLPTTPVDDECEGDLLQYSSGTTGQPKGIKREIEGRPIGLDGDTVVGFFDHLGFGEGDVYLSPAPLYHSAPIYWTMSTHRLGGTVVVMERFDPIDTLRLIQKYSVTHAQFVPTMFVRMLKLPVEERSRFDLSSLRSVVHAAAPCAVEVKRAMLDWWGPIIHEYYSSSEGAGATWITADEWLAHPGSVGRAILGTPHIVDDDGVELPPGEPGTIWFDGGREFDYLGDAAKTSSSRNEKGWRTVGDVGYLDEQGYLYLTDRRAFTIIAGGVNIYPQEAEDVLITHPQVYDVAVFGVPDDDLGEAVKAVVRPMSMGHAGPALETELIDYCRSKLAAYKCPRSVDFTNELPRSDTGKLYKRLLKAQYWPSS
jgi:acyl-CoA synthetase (AMP-forming)/AMP-acid ligase II